MKFHVNNTASASGTSLRDHIVLPYTQLLNLFGNALEGDHYKTSTEWRFESESGKVCTLYDYKDTSLYDTSLMTPEDFRRLKEFEWHIGADNSETATAFKKWLLQQQERPT